MSTQHTHRPCQGTCPKCGPVALDFDDEDNHYCRKCGGAIDAAPTGTARDLTARALRFNNTTGALSWSHKSAALHPDRCACQDEVTPHKHYDEPPHACARCGKCEAYRPAVGLVAAPPPPPAEHGAPKVGCTRPDGLLNVHPESETCDECAPPVPAVPANGTEGDRGARDAIAWLRGNPPYHMTAADVIDTIERLAREASEAKAALSALVDSKCADVTMLRARVAELEASAEEARNDLITELIEGVAEIGCIYGGDVKEPQITGREEVVAGLEKLREMLGGGR